MAKKHKPGKYGDWDDSSKGDGDALTVFSGIDCEEKVRTVIDEDGEERMDLTITPWEKKPYVRPGQHPNYDLIDWEE